jgi:2-methylcitrate dehydratase PrpD
MSQHSGTALARRKFLQNSGLIFAIAGLCPAFKIAAQTAEKGSAQIAGPVMVQLSTYMSEARNKALPPDVLEQTKQHTLDTLAAMISGCELPPGRAALTFAREYGGEQVSTVVASTIVCGPIEAALTNGVLAHSDETDDSHAPSQSHPGCGVVPAALASGERFAISGEHFLRAVTLGYDVGTRVTMSLGGSVFESEGHKSTHSVANNFGAAAASGCAAGLNLQQMRWLLDYASQQSSGTSVWQRDTQHIEKAFVFGGMPARNGVTAALLVHSGWTGVEDVLSGSDNFYLAYAPQGNPEELVDKLGERYEVTRTNIKKWTVGSPIQAPLDALEILLKRSPFELAQLKEIVVHVGTHEAMVVNNRDMPDICLQHMIALMLVDKSVTFRSAHDKERMHDPVILAERRKVQLIPDRELERKMPQREAIVELTFADGTKLTQRVDAVRGTAQNPMSREEVIAKSKDLIVPVLGEAACASLIEKVFHLEDVKDIRELRTLLRRG